MESTRQYMGFEIVETDSGFGARPIDSNLTIGMEGTYQGHATIEGLEAQIKADADYFSTQTPDA